MSPSSFKVMGLISRSQQQKIGCAQVCAPLGHSLRDVSVMGEQHTVEYTCVHEHSDLSLTLSDKLVSRGVASHLTHYRLFQ